MNIIIKKVLEEIENNGFEAYVVGGYVRDSLLGIESNDIDICTNALPKDIHKIFPNNNGKNNYGGFNIKIKDCNIDITTYRKDVLYENGKLLEHVYINNLIDDLKRRDFTINTFCMDSNGAIIDLLNAHDDLQNGLIKAVGEASTKFIEDPLRMLRGIRFAAVLKFKLSEEVELSIREYKSLLLNTSKIKIKEEIIKMLADKSFNKSLEYLNYFELNDILGLKYDRIIYTADINGMLAQFELFDYPMSKSEKKIIADIKTIVNIGHIDNEILYSYGLYLCLCAGDILGITKKTINDLFNSLPIQDKQDIDIDFSKISNDFEIKDFKIIGYLEKRIIKDILALKLDNIKKTIYDKIPTYIKEYSGE